MRRRVPPPNPTLVAPTLNHVALQKLDWVGAWQVPGPNTAGRAPQGQAGHQERDTDRGWPHGGWPRVQRNVGAQGRCAAGVGSQQSSDRLNRLSGKSRRRKKAGKLSSRAQLHLGARSPPARPASQRGRIGVECGATPSRKEVCGGQNRAQHDAVLAGPTQLLRDASLGWLYQWLIEQAAPGISCACTPTTVARRRPDKPLFSCPSLCDRRPAGAVLDDRGVDLDAPDMSERARSAQQQPSPVLPPTVRLPRPCTRSPLRASPHLPASLQRSGAADGAARVLPAR